MSRNLAVFSVFALLTLGLAGTGRAEPATDFAVRLREALLGTPNDWDALWAPGLRDSSTRMLDLRTAALFEWPEASVTVESAEKRSDGKAEDYVVDLLVRGRADWEARAYGVAKAFWALQLDESAPSNEVVRRESWRLVPTKSGWRAAERVLLSPVEIVEEKIVAGIYPGQSAMLLDCSYYLRSLAPGVRFARFLLDRRAFVYDLRIDGVQADVARGGELGSLGLEGFSPEVESSLRFPEPLAQGEEVLVKFKIRAPLVHLEGDGFVTTLGFRDGPFRERAWLPIFAPPRIASSAPTEPVVELTVHWPKGEFPAAAITGRPSVARELDGERLRLEEESASSTENTPRGVDFLLGNAGAVPAGGWRVTGSTLWVDEVTTGPGLPLDPHRRSRASLVGALLDASSSYSSQDLNSSLDELLPLDIEVLDEFRDEDTGADAEQGADDRSAG
jgi:hypothetical protein